MRLAQFGSGGSRYVFPDGAEYSDNFGDLVQRTQRLPGLSGGYRHYGFDPSAKEIGSVRVGYWLRADTPLEMQQKLDAVSRMQSFGLRRLYLREWGSSGEYRWTDAEVSSINTPVSVKNRPDETQRVDITFQCPDPFWNEVGTESWVWGDGTLWGEGALWGGGAVARNVSLTVNDFVETVAGNATTFPRLLLTVPAGGSVTNPIIRRMDGSTILDEVKYTGTLGAGATWDINCRTMAVKVGGADGFTSAFDYRRANFFRLEPGNNDIRVLFSAVTGVPTLTLRYYTRW